MSERKAYLVLSDGTVYEGVRIGALTDAVGELVFTTGMVGYVETLTDPSYAGQIIMQTFPLIGNYGVCEEDFEGQPCAKGYVVRELCETPSNFRSEYSLDAFLKKNGIPGIAGIDTRSITRRIREYGVMNARICSAPDEAGIKDYQVRGVVPEVSCTQKMFFAAQGTKKHHVVLLDYGAKKNIIRSLNQRGCDVTVVPHDTSAKEVMGLNPDGIMLSNGPGDPAENTAEIAVIRELLGQVPVFGICLGHQLTALAKGGQTVKLKYGHRGANQPVRDLETGRTYITTQNHGYAVVSESMAGKGRLRFVNANDNSCEGMDYPDDLCFTVQFHPEACAGPRDTAFLFDRFIRMMEVAHAEG